MYFKSLYFKMTNIENKKTTEVDNVTGDELLELKKKLADEVVDKLIEKDPNIISFFFKWSMADYLIDDDTISDLVNDKILWGVWESTWLITPTLKRYREMFSNANTKNELESLRTTIFNEIWWIEQVSASIQESSSRTPTQTKATPSSSNEWNKKSSDSKNKSESSTESKKTKDSKKNNDNKSEKSNESSASLNEKSKEGTKNGYEIDKINITASPEAKKLWDSLKWKEKPNLEPFACGLKAYETEKAKWHLNNTKYLTIVDFTKNQLKNNRFFVINLDTNTVEYSEKCWHGKNSGGKEWATSFSNTKNSNQSSLWAWKTAETQRWNKKKSRQWNFPKWFESSNNRSRWIAIHPVWSFLYKTWQLTSLWCFTLTCWKYKVKEILEKIDWWSMVFSYAKSEKYFSQSKYFQKNSNGSYTA